MKLQKQISRKIGDKAYAKYVVVIPPKAVAQAGWSADQHLTFTAQNGGIFLKKGGETYGRRDKVARGVR